ncbi:MAG: ATP synthase F1 subunit delta [SAR202 cluster bacterium]|jgi:F-type H+-transporting ATPase subunit delta|nr:ATP synthase F1 subunit delta [Dehalococcoidia bacterium]MQG81042.1 ATP synthase F1 subunit delta [SAR202 cluster bacterium]
MAKQVSGDRYARALFELASEKGTVDDWLVQLDLAVQVLNDDEFRALLNHAEVSLLRKREAVEAVLAEVDPMVQNLISLLVARGSVGVVGDVYDNYTRLVDIAKGRQRVELTSAVELEDNQIDKIKVFVEGLVKKEVVIHTSVDESILGGIVIQIGDQLLDGSTKTQLEGLRKQVRSEVVVS